MSGFTDHFSLAGSALAPQPWMQLRGVATGQTTSVSRSYDPSDGQAKSDLIQTLTVDWTNTSPVSQYVYGMVTKSGSQVTLQCRSRGYLATSHAVHVGTGTPTLDMTEVSRFGVGSDLGNGGLLNLGGAYAISELRQNSTSVPLMPHLTQWFLVAAGETITAKIEVRFVSESWENTQIDGGDGDTESKVVTGDVRLDLFAVPTTLKPLPREIPTVVGIAYDRETDTTFAGTQTQVSVPAGTAAGDTILAIVCNNLGLFGDVGPLDSGWTQIHDRNADVFNNSLDVHMRIYIRTAAGSGGSYSFQNSFLSEQTAILITLRDASPHEASLGRDWYAASNVSSYRFVEEQVAPSITRNGQLLVCVSFFAHATLQSPIAQAPPSGMTEIGDFAGTGTTVAVATLASPPNPTKDRKFTPNKVPLFNGHSISATILVPGVQNYA